MKAEHITYSGTDLDYSMANSLAQAVAQKDRELLEPVIVAWHDKRESRMSPDIAGADVNTRWRDYGESHGGELEVDVNGEFDFVFADASCFEKYGPSSYRSLHDQLGQEYICLSYSLSHPHNASIPSHDACVALDEWTSKLT